MIKTGDFLYCHKEMTGMLKLASESNYPTLLKVGNSYCIQKIWWAISSGNRYLTIINEEGREHSFPIKEEKRVIGWNTVDGVSMPLYKTTKLEDWFIHLGPVKLLDVEKVLNELHD